MLEKIKALIAEVPDFPKPGILFYDITPVLADAQAFESCLELLEEKAKALGANKIAGIESRGFIFGTPLATRLGLGFVPIRKPNKLPRPTYQASFTKEYGEDTIEVHRDAFAKQDRVLIVDDLLATGGTAQAAAALVTQTGATLAGFLFAVELADLKGRERIAGAPCEALIVY